jgi:hypothetical protein
MSEARATAIQQIIQAAMRTGLLTAAQEHELNLRLFQDGCSEADFFLLRRLHSCLRLGSIRQVPSLPNPVARGCFGAPLVTDKVEEAQPQPCELSRAHNPKVS